MKLPSRENVLIFIGLVTIMVGTSVLVPIATIILQQHGKIEVSDLVTNFRITIGAIGALLIFWGTITIGCRKREAVVNLNILFIIIVLVAPLIMEGTLRVGIALGLSMFRVPEFYAHPYGDVDYFKLRTLWGLDKARPRLKGQSSKGNGSISVVGYDPHLGWATKKTPKNPLGVMTATPYVLV